MKKQVLLIGGGDSFTKHEDFLSHLRTATLRSLPGAESTLRWSQTLVEDLGPDFEVFVPSMPNKQNANYEEWKIWLERHFEYLNDGVVLIGWSLGGMFLAKYLSENNTPFNIKALFLLAAPCGTYGDGTGNDCGSFQFSPAILANLDKKALKINIFHSKDDFVVPFEHALSYKKFLPEAELMTFEDKNHFLVPALPELLSRVS